MGRESRGRHALLGSDAGAPRTHTAYVLRVVLDYIDHADSESTISFERSGHPARLFVCGTHFLVREIKKASSAHARPRAASAFSTVPHSIVHIEARHNTLERFAAPAKILKFNVEIHRRIANGNAHPSAFGPPHANLVIRNRLITAILAIPTSIPLSVQNQIFDFRS